MRGILDWQSLGIQFHVQIGRCSVARVGATMLCHCPSRRVPEPVTRGEWKEYRHTSQNWFSALSVSS